jgi:hypothetical protein
MKDLRRVKDKMVSDFPASLEVFDQSLSSSHEVSRDRSSISMLRYLHASYLLAHLFPAFPEIGVILQYKMLKVVSAARREVRRSYDKRFDFFAQTLSRVLVFTFTSMIRLPQPIQDSGVQIFLIGFFIRLAVPTVPLLVALPALTTSPLAGSRERHTETRSSQRLIHSQRSIHKLRLYLHQYKQGRAMTILLNFPPTLFFFFSFCCPNPWHNSSISFCSCERALPSFGPHIGANNNSQICQSNCSVSVSTTAPVIRSVRTALPPPY